MNTYVTTFYLDNQIYVPIHGVFNDLKIYNTLDMHRKTLEGFYTSQSDKYEIDFSHLRATVGDTTFKFDSTEFIYGPVDIYVLPSLYEQLFKLHFITDMNKLELILNTDVKLPIIQNYERNLRLQYQTQPLGIFRPQAPLEYPEYRSLFNGGVFDYQLSAFEGSNGPSYSYNLDGGAQLLGGDLEGALNGNIANGVSTIYSKQLHWRYTIDSTKAITSISLGNLFSDGLTQYDFRGIQISNVPVQLRRFFGEYSVLEKVQPGWDTELFLNGERVGYARADALGNVHYTIPLVYGTSYIQMKTYGPSGQYREIDKRMQIPFTLIPKGEFDYNLNAGVLTNSDSVIAQFNMAYGFTNWLTDKVGVDYLQSIMDKRPVPYNSLSMRIGTPYIVTLQAAPGYGYEFDLNAIYPSQASLSLTYDRYDQNPVYNTANKANQLFATAYLPFYFGNNSLNFSFSGTGQTFEDGSRNVTYSPGINASVGRFNFSVNYTGSYLGYVNSAPVYGKTVSSSLLYSIFFGSGPLSFLNGALSGISSDYNLETKSLTTVRFDFSQYFGTYVSMQLSAQRDLLNKANSLNLEITCDLPFIQTSSSANYQGTQASFAEFASGSIGYDSHYEKFMFNGIHWVGQSAVSMRMYLDDNQDGVFDKGDEVITDGSMTLRQATSSDKFTSGIIRSWNLQPYSQYSVDIQSGSLRNPLWMPDRESFSFMTDPNVYKAIDIPFYSAGVIQGKVLRLDRGKQVPVPGLEVIVEATHGLFRKTISAFNDGSLYYVGIPPGDYRIAVDPSQLEALGDTSEPAFREFSVKFKRAGDFIKGLNFLLKPAPKPKVIIAQTPPTKKYLVQLGAFWTPANADDFAANARKATHMNIRVVYNSGSHLYSVQLDTMNDSRRAYSVVEDLIYNYGMRDAFVMVIPEEKFEYTFSVRVGLFHTLGEATRFASESRMIFGREANIDFDSPLKAFEVTLGAFDSEKNAQSLAYSIGSDRRFRNAPVIVTGHYLRDRYAVLLNVFRSYDDAEDYARDTFNSRKIDALIDFDYNTSLFQVHTIPTQDFGTSEKVLQGLRRLHMFKFLRVIRVR